MGNHSPYSKKTRRRGAHPTVVRSLQHLAPRRASGRVSLATLADSVDERRYVCADQLGRRLDQLLEDGGDSRLLMLSGVGGSGKSAALREAARRGERLGYHVIALDGRQLVAAGPRLTDLFRRPSGRRPAGPGRRAGPPRRARPRPGAHPGHPSRHHLRGHRRHRLSARLAPGRAAAAGRGAPDAGARRRGLAPGAQEPRCRQRLRSVGDQQLGVRAPARAGAGRGRVDRARRGRDPARRRSAGRDRERPGRSPVGPRPGPARHRCSRWWRSPAGWTTGCWPT
jgi:hypothetical protein